MVLSFLFFLEFLVIFLCFVKKWKKSKLLSLYLILWSLYLDHSICKSDTVDTWHWYNRNTTNACATASLIMIMVVVLMQCSCVCFYVLRSNKLRTHSSETLRDIATATVYNMLLSELDTTVIDNHWIVVVGATIICWNKYVYMVHLTNFL